MNASLFFAMLLALVVAAVVVAAAEDAVDLAAKVAKVAKSTKSPSTVTKSPNVNTSKQSNLKKKVVKKKGSPKSSTFTGGLLFNVNSDPCGTGNAFETGVGAAVLSAVTGAFTSTPTVSITNCQAFARRKLTETEAYKAAVTNEHLTAFTTAVVSFTVAGTPTTSVADVQTAFTGGITTALTTQSTNFPAGTAWTGTASLGPTGSTPVYTTAEPTSEEEPPACECTGPIDCGDNLCPYSCEICT